jgi:hypothetical protein
MRGAEKLMGLVVYINERPYTISELHYVVEFEIFFITLTDEDGLNKNYPINDIIPFLRNKFPNNI